MVDTYLDLHVHVLTLAWHDHDRYAIQLSIQTQATRTSCSPFFVHQKIRLQAAHLQWYQQPYLSVSAGRDKLRSFQGNTCRLEVPLQVWTNFQRSAITINEHAGTGAAVKPSS